MDLRAVILKEEAEFQKLFAHYEEREWGILFFNEQAPASNDSNHAVLYPEKIADFETVLIEIKDFYTSKKLSPRLYQPFINGYFSERKEILNRHGFEIKIFGLTGFFVLTAENSIIIKPQLDIRRIKQWDERLATDVYIPSDEEYAIEPEKNNIKNENYYLFAGFLGDEIVAVISFHKSKYGCTRFDYILTSIKHRGKGYAKEMMNFAVEFCKNNGFENCYTWFASPYSEKIAYEAGFRQLFEVETGTAFCE
ncbi:MAG: GNAT family N-acetyltransferase [Oscillospiraceae bacterium]|jgi:GNAT superfamily N-acetyltransferase|nr:GNAT family N-acetyltransferase [Oscillospiraceae bacterium]